MDNFPLESGRKRVPSDVLKRGYADDELATIYELGRFSLENGNLRRGEVIMKGLTETAPDYAPAWLGLSYVHIQNGNIDGAIHAARSALRVEPDFVEATLYLIACLLTTGDVNSAGTYLGEVGEKIDSGAVENPNCVRFYKLQLSRYESR